MGFRIRVSKSFRIGKGSRITFSRSGISTSTRIGPFRIGANTSGQSWLSASKGGITAQQTFTTPRRSSRTRSLQQAKTYSMQPPTSTNSSMARSYPGPAGPAQNGVSQQQWPFLQPSPPPLKLHQYSGREIAFIVGINALFIPAIGIDDTVGAIVLLLALTTVGYALVVDGAGVGTLRGAMRWVSMSAGARVWAVIGWLCLYPFFWWYYCGRITYDWYQVRKAASQQRAFTIARMESDLGFQPTVEGACASCGKPLTVGAAFCSYCGHATQVKAKVCPKCATLAPADGQFCPACRTPLA